MRDRIFLSPPDVGTDEEAAVLRAIRSGWVAPLGPEVDSFETELARWTDRRYAVALSSGTAALHLGLLGLGAGHGRVVVTASMTFAATANAVLYTGATPVFVDCDEHGNMDPGLLIKAVSEQRSMGQSVAAVLPVDMLGRVAPYEEIQAVADAYGIPVLADAAESLGAVGRGRPAGNSGHAAALSFNGNKIITTSGGGALLTDDAELANRTRHLATQARQPVSHYEHTEIGYNYRLSNVLAALGRSQLARLPAFIEKRRLWRRLYAEIFHTVPGVQLLGDDGSDALAATRDNYWLSSVLVDPALAGWTAADLRAHLEQTNIESRALWKPMHMQPAYAHFPAYLSGTSERLFATGITLPSGSGMTQSEFGRVCQAIDSFLQRATG